jgi:hypothetical protein
VIGKIVLKQSSAGTGRQKSQLTERQLKPMQMGKKYGLIPLLIRVKVYIEAPFKEIKIKEL